MPAPFRSADEWKSSLMLLPDNAFFDLMRSVFGNVKTPFNKQRLLDDLAAFLCREDIRRNLAAYISAGDAKLIAAVAALHEPVPEDIESFFAGEYTFAELHAMLLNLEERFILYRIRRDGVRHLALNPLLEPILEPYITDRRVLFPSSPALPQGQRQTPPASDDRILAALFAFTGEDREFFKAEGGIRKKMLDSAKHIFPGLPVQTMIGGLQCLGLLHADGLSLLRDEQKCRDFASLSRRERMEYFSAGIYVFLSETEHSAGPIPFYVYQNYIKFLSIFIHQFVSLIENDRIYPLFTLRRIANLLEMEITLNRTGGRQLNTADRRIHIETLLEALRLTGLLETCGKDWRIVPRISDAGAEIAAGQAERPCIAMDTPFSCILYPEIAFADALALSSFCNVQTGGHDSTLICFELSRASVIRGFDLGMDAASMLELLDRLSGRRLDESTGWNLRDWEKRYTAVSLYQGMVLCIAPENRYLAESPEKGNAEEAALRGSRQKKPDSQSGPLAPLIARVLAPGVYLLSVSDKAEALDALEKAGVDIIAQPSGPVKKAWGTEFRRSAYPALKDILPEEVFFMEERERIPDGGILGGADAAPEAGAAPDTPAGNGSERGEALKEMFRQTLKERRVSKAEQEELASRIERSMIVSESQLEGVFVRYEKLEARGLDYVGKAAIVKQAMAAKSFVEVFWSGAGGIVQQALGIPESLEKSGGGTILLLRVMQEEHSGGSELIRLPLGKISLIRRIKQSIFED
ncbi:MAG: helicase-associated domain-containing protein [Treponema sp.]|jgi:hypothetical protein|nr:helicase-associated domain-containing protein [Treponema sp.]